MARSNGGRTVSNDEPEPTSRDPHGDADHSNGDEMPDFELPEAEGSVHEASPRERPTDSIHDGADQFRDRVDNDRHGHDLGADSMSRREARVLRRRRAIKRFTVPTVTFFAGVLVTLLALVAVPAIQSVAQRGSEAELQRVVAEYIGALNNGDFAAASNMVEFDVQAADDSVVAAGVVPDYFEGLICNEPVIKQTKAVLDCTFGISVGGLPAQVLFQSEGGSWEISQGLARPVSFTQAIVPVDSIDGVPIPDEVVEGQRQIWMYPGTYYYEGKIPPGFQSSPGSQPVLSVFDGYGQVWDSVEPTPEVIEETRAAAIAYIEACSLGVGDGCPNMAPPVEGETFMIYDNQMTSTSNSDGRFSFTYWVGRTGYPQALYKSNVLVSFDENYDYYTVTAFR
ncbi:hypothetical protein [Humidisolicoccus flavus]|uniref:hypothetical protein n=1 Tax=Humidisolicoccus flavus TaxID=3111414 RepID=UPI0032462F60